MKGNTSLVFGFHASINLAWELIDDASNYMAVDIIFLDISRVLFDV